jgi:GNAT superfamily N-acetyltransferase
MSAPPYRIAPLAPEHRRGEFSCGVPALDDYMHRYARQQRTQGVAAIYIASPQDDPGAIIGYYTLATASIATTELPPDASRRLPPYPRQPAILLGRLAIDRRWQRQGFGAILVADALARCREITPVVAARFLVVDATNAEARAFYVALSFTALPDHPDTLFLVL